MRKLILGIVVFLMMQAVNAEQIALSGPVESSPTLADINDNPSDGLEIVVGANSDYMHAVYSNVTKMRDWRIDTSGTGFLTGISSPAIVDLNGDGKKEILVGGQQGASMGSSNPGYAWAYYINWTRMWRYATISTSIFSSPTVADIDSASGYEVLVGSSTNKLYALRSGGSLYWSATFGGSLVGTAAVGDLDKDGKLEVVVSSSDGVVHVLWGNGTEITWMQTGGQTSDLFVSSPALADLDNDGKPEIISASAGGNVYAWHGNGTLLGGWPVSAGAVYTPSPAVGDLDNDGDLEVVVVTGNNDVYAYHADGRLLDGFPLIHSEKIGHASPALADLDGDGKLEIILGVGYSIYNDTTQSSIRGGRVYAWHMDGTLMQGFPQNTGHWIKSSPAVADIDGDGKNEVVIGSDDGSLYIFGGTGKSDNLGWPRFHYDETNTRMYDAPTARIASPLNGSYHKRGVPVSFSANANDVDGTIALYQWDSSVDGSVGSSASFTANLSLGAHVISLKAQDDEGKSTNARTEIMVVENLPPTATISSPSNGSTYSIVESISFSGLGSDEDGTIASYQWTSDRDGVLGTSGDVTVSNLSLGEHTITLTVVDDIGASGSASIRLSIVNLPPTALILSPINESTYATGKAVAFSGYGLDIDGIVASYQWSSDRDGIIGSGGNATLSNLSLGGHTITLTVVDNLGAKGNTSISLVIVEPERAPSGGGGVVQSPVEALLSPGVSNMNSVAYANTLLALVAEGKLDKTSFVETSKTVAASFLLTKRYQKPTDNLAAQISKTAVRIEGDPYALSAMASEYKGFKLDAHKNELIVARGDLEVDSLAAVAYAKARNIPILLTKPGELPEVTEKAISTMMESGKREIIIVGGPVAVSPVVEEKLGAMGSVKRLYGRTRVETAAVLAEVAYAGDVKNIVITNDARPLADAALLSYLLDAPLLYVRSGELPTVVKDYLTRHKRTIGGPTKVLLMDVDEKVAREVEKIMK